MILIRIAASKSNTFIPPEVENGCFRSGDMAAQKIQAIYRTSANLDNERAAVPIELERQQMNSSRGPAAEMRK